jgi:hypothetical protein
MHFRIISISRKAPAGVIGVSIIYHNTGSNTTGQAEVRRRPQFCTFAPSYQPGDKALIR